MNRSVQVFGIFWNEQDIIQDFIDWYKLKLPNAKITIIDNESDDKTVEIAKNNGCNVIIFNTNGYMDEKTLMELRNNIWRYINSEWVIIVDSDEFVDITHDVLNNADWNVAKCVGYEMFGEGESIENLLYGCKSEGYSKASVFNKNEIENMNFEAGSHIENPISKEGFKVKFAEDRPNLYHTKWRSWDNGINRAHILSKKISGHSTKMRWNFHYGLPDSTHKEKYDNGIKDRIKVR
jgi:glycosyltransferase involved in cell wall biosynthesis